MSEVNNNYENSDGFGGLVDSGECNEPVTKLSHFGNLENIPDNHCVAEDTGSHQQSHTMMVQNMAGYPTTGGNLLGVHDQLGVEDGHHFGAMMGENAANSAQNEAQTSHQQGLQQHLPQLHHPIYRQQQQGAVHQLHQSSMPGQRAAQQMANQQQHQTGDIVMEMEDPEDSEDEGGPGRSEKRAGRRKIRIEYIEDKSRRHITFSKRKAGIMKKAYELSTLTGTQVLLLVASETGHVYTFATPKLQPLITKPEGKNLIQACLNAPDGSDYQSPDYEHEEEVTERQTQANATANMAAIPQNYAAAIAGLAGYQYPTGAQGSASMAQAYLNQAAHYPAYASQYNNMAAAYWPQQQQQQQMLHQQQQQAMAQQQSGHSSGTGSPGGKDDDGKH